MTTKTKRIAMDGIIVKTHLHAHCECGGEFVCKIANLCADWKIKFPHACNRCHRQVELQKMYPHVVDEQA